MEAYMRWAVPQYGAPPLYHLAVALTCATHELARRGFYLDDGSKTPMALWVAIVGPSETGKSGAIDMGRDFLQSLWEESSNVPMVDPWVQADGSIAGLFASLQEYYDSSRGTTVALLHEEEFSGILASRDAVTEFLCKLHDGRTQQKNLRELQRGNRGQARQDRIIEPRISALLASTENALAQVFTDAMRRGGLWSRLWWICPSLATWKGRPIPEHLAEPYTVAVDTWLGWLVQLSMFESRGLRVGPEAMQLWTEAFYGTINDTDKELVEDDTGTNGRLRLLARAKLLAVVIGSMAGRPVAALEDMQAALALSNVAAVGASRLQLLGTDTEVRGAERVRRYIAKAGEAGINRRGLYQELRMSKRNLDMALDQLTDAQSIVEDRSAGRVRYYAAETERGDDLAKRQPVPGTIVRLGKKPGSDEDDGSGRPN